MSKTKQQTSFEDLKIESFVADGTLREMYYFLKYHYMTKGIYVWAMRETFVCFINNIASQSVNK